MPYSFSQPQWDNAKEEIRQILIEVAKKSNVIFYSDLVSQVTAIRLEPDSYALHDLLGTISTDEDAAGRGMLSVVVVNMAEYQPGSGFFDLAKHLGKKPSDPTTFFSEELKKVYSVWSKAKHS